jgi:hypothetical protein
MILEQRLKRSISMRKDAVFVRTEFAHMGSAAQVSRALRGLVAAGVLVKLGVGVYAKAKKSVLSGNAIPIQPVDVLASVALRKLGVEIFPSLLAQQYNAGGSTQVPAGNVINTGKRRIKRTIVFGQQMITYENS